MFLWIKWKSVQFIQCWVRVGSKQFPFSPYIYSLTEWARNDFGELVYMIISQHFSPLTQKANRQLREIKGNWKKGVVLCSLLFLDMQKKSRTQIRLFYILSRLVLLERPVGILSWCLAFQEIYINISLHSLKVSRGWNGDAEKFLLYLCNWEGQLYFIAVFQDEFIFSVNLCRFHSDFVFHSILKLIFLSSWRWQWFTGSMFLSTLLSWYQVPWRNFYLGCFFVFYYYFFFYVFKIFKFKNVRHLYSLWSDPPY